MTSLDHGNVDVLAMPASRHQSDNLSFKEDGIDLLVMPSSLNDKLSLWCPTGPPFVRTADLRASSRYAVR